MIVSSNHPSTILSDYLWLLACMQLAKLAQTRERRRGVILVLIVRKLWHSGRAEIGASMRMIGRATLIARQAENSRGLFASWRRNPNEHLLMNYGYCD